MTEIVLVLTTVSSVEVGERIARALVEERLAACVNVGAAMTSIYRWKGSVEQDTECQLVIKTTNACLVGIETRLKALHPYELPELLVLPVALGGQTYLDWIASETRC